MIECLGPFSPNDGERNGRVPSLPLFSKDKILRTDDSLYRHVLSQSPKERWEREKEGTLWENQESAAWMVHAVVQVGHLHRYKHLAMADSSCMQRGQISPRSGWGPTSDQSSLSLEKVKISINICELPYLVMASLCFFSKIWDYIKIGSNLADMWLNYAWACCILLVILEGCSCQNSETKQAFFTSVCLLLSFLFFPFSF